MNIRHIFAFCVIFLGTINCKYQDNLENVASMLKNMSIEQISQSVNTFTKIDHETEVDTLFYSIYENEAISKLENLILECKDLKDCSRIDNVLNISRSCLKDTGLLLNILINPYWINDKGEMFSKNFHQILHFIDNIYQIIDHLGFQGPKTYAKVLEHYQIIQSIKETITKDLGLKESLIIASHQVLRKRARSFSKIEELIQLCMDPHFIPFDAYALSNITYGWLEKIHNSIFLNELDALVITINDKNVTNTIQEWMYRFLINMVQNSSIELNRIQESLIHFKNIFRVSLNDSQLNELSEMCIKKLDLNWHQIQHRLLMPEKLETFLKSKRLDANAGIFGVDSCAIEYINNQRNETEKVLNGISRILTNTSGYNPMHNISLTEFENQMVQMYLLYELKQRISNFYEWIREPLQFNIESGVFMIDNSSLVSKLIIKTLKTWFDVCRKFYEKDNNGNGNGITIKDNTDPFRLYFLFESVHEDEFKEFLKPYLDAVYVGSSETFQGKDYNLFLESIRDDYQTSCIISVGKFEQVKSSIVGKLLLLQNTNGGSRLVQLYQELESSMNTLCQVFQEASSIGPISPFKLANYKLSPFFLSAPWMTLQLFNQTYLEQFGSFHPDISMSYALLEIIKGQIYSNTFDHMIILNSHYHDSYDISRLLFDHYQIHVLPWIELYTIWKIKRDSIIAEMNDKQLNDSDIASICIETLDLVISIWEDLKPSGTSSMIYHMELVHVQYPFLFQHILKHQESNHDFMIETIRSIFDHMTIPSLVHETVAMKCLKQKFGQNDMNECFEFCDRSTFETWIAKECLYHTISIIFQQTQKFIISSASSASDIESSLKCTTPYLSMDELISRYSSLEYVKNLLVFHEGMNIENKIFKSVSDCMIQRSKWEMYKWLKSRNRLHHPEFTTFNISTILGYGFKLIHKIGNAITLQINEMNENFPKNEAIEEFIQMIYETTSIIVPKLLEKKEKEYTDMIDKSKAYQSFCDELEQFELACNDNFTVAVDVSIDRYESCFPFKNEITYILESFSKMLNGIVEWSEHSIIEHYRYPKCLEIGNFSRENIQWILEYKNIMEEYDYYYKYNLHLPIQKMNDCLSGMHLFAKQVSLLSGYVEYGHRAKLFHKAIKYLNLIYESDIFIVNNMWWKLIRVAISIMEKYDGDYIYSYQLDSLLPVIGKKRQLSINMTFPWEIEEFSFDAQRVICNIDTKIGWLNDSKKWNCNSESRSISHSVDVDSIDNMIKYHHGINESELSRDILAPLVLYKYRNNPKESKRIRDALVEFYENDKSMILVIEEIFRDIARDMDLDIKETNSNDVLSDYVDLVWDNRSEAGKRNSTVIIGSKTIHAGMVEFPMEKIASLYTGKLDENSIPPNEVTILECSGILKIHELAMNHTESNLGADAVTIDNLAQKSLDALEAKLSE